LVQIAPHPRGYLIICLVLKKIDHKLKCMSVVRIRLKTSFPPKIYAESLKKQVVREYENGLLNKDQLMRKYGTSGKVWS